MSIQHEANCSQTARDCKPSYLMGLCVGETDDVRTLKSKQPAVAGCCLVFGLAEKLISEQFEFSLVEKTCQLEKRINYVISLTCSPPPQKERRHVFRHATRVYERPLVAVRDPQTIPTAW